jgi:hypothetical protein
MISAGIKKVRKYPKNNDYRPRYNLMHPGPLIVLLPPEIGSTLISVEIRSFKADIWEITPINLPDCI